jgi:two-component system sensor histidine kinase YesM
MLKKEGNMNSEKKFGGLIVILFILLALVFTFNTYKIANRLLVNKYEELNQINVDYLLDDINHQFKQLNTTFNYLIQNDDIRRILNKKSEILTDKEKIEVSSFLDSSISSLLSFDIIKYINVIELKTFTNQQYWVGVGSNFHESIWVDKIAKQIDYAANSIEYQNIQSSVFRLTTDSPALIFFKPFYKLDGTPLGYYYFELDSAFFNENIGLYKPKVGSSIYLIDKNNDILFSNNNKNVGSSFNKENNKVNEGKSVLVSSLLPSFDWKLIIQSSKLDIFRYNHLVFLFSMVIAFVFAIIELIIMYIALKQLFEPINSLSNGLEILGNGDFSKRIEVVGHNDIAKACDNFNKLANELESEIQKELDYQSRLKDSEYKALQAQINPHFLYNSLNSIKWIANIQQSDNIVRLVDSLWNLFKSASKQKGQTIKLKDEIELVKSYAYIQSIRYKSKFIVNYKIKGYLYDFLLPKFIIQPFVENSIFHGIAPKEGDGSIDINIDEDGNFLRIIIIDDGIGMTEEKVKSLFNEQDISNRGKGLNNIAISNIIDRLYLLYDRKDLLSIQSAIDKGTKVIIRIPIIDQPEFNTSSSTRLINRMKYNENNNSCR